MAGSLRTDGITGCARGVVGTDGRIGARTDGATGAEGAFPTETGFCAGANERMVLARGFSTTGGCRAGSTRPSSQTEKRGGPPTLPEAAGGVAGALRTVGAEGAGRTFAAAGGVADALSPAALAPLFKGIFHERGAGVARSGTALF